jgi:hypothetical protein
VSIRETMAGRRRVPVRMHLGELNAVLNACLDAGAGGRHAVSDLTRAARAVEKVRDRRRRAVERAGS